MVDFPIQLGLREYVMRVLDDIAIQNQYAVIVLILDVLGLSCPRIADTFNFMLLLEGGDKPFEE